MRKNIDLHKTPSNGAIGMNSMAENLVLLLVSPKSGKESSSRRKPPIAELDNVWAIK
jgi:hypothetical protein